MLLPQTWSGIPAGIKEHEQWPDVMLRGNSQELVEALLEAPPALKLGERIQAHILRRRRPTFLDVVNVNTGARMTAGPLGRLLGRVRQKVLAKLGVKGYQPYERLGLWLRRELRPLVAEVLLDPRCLDRGIFHPPAVRAVIERHNTGRGNHTFLILAMLIFEAGQRMFADGSGIPSEPAWLVSSGAPLASR